MENTKQIITEVLPKTKVYFDSIEEQFNYRQKHNWKFELFSSVRGIVIFLIIFTYIPLIPAAIGAWGWLTSNVITVYTLEIKLDNFFIRWILLSVILSILLFAFLNPIDKFLDKRREKYSIGYNHLTFAYLYKSIKGLEIFIINGHHENSIKALDYLKWYFRRCFIYTSLSIKAQTESVNLSHHLEEISKENPWIKYDETTANIIDGFKDFEEKIYQRIEEKADIDVCVRILQELLVFEYLQLDKVTEDQINSIETDIETVAPKLILEVSSDLIALSKIETKKEGESKSKADKLESFFDKLTGLFNHSSILITFFSWFVLLSVITIGIIYFGIKTAELKLDSTIFIGAVSAVLVGSITLAATIYNKQKENTTNKN